MRIKVIWSLLSLAALAAGGLIQGCDSDTKLAKSGPGEDCTKTSDCNDGLKCLQGVCYKSGTDTGGSANEGGGAGMEGPPPAVLSGPDESCSKTADCQDG